MWAIVKILSYVVTQLKGFLLLLKLTKLSQNTAGQELNPRSLPCPAKYPIIELPKHIRWQSWKIFPDFSRWWATLAIGRVESVVSGYPGHPRRETGHTGESARFPICGSFLLSFSWLVCHGTTKESFGAGCVSGFEWKLTVTINRISCDFYFF